MIEASLITGARSMKGLGKSDRRKVAQRPRRRYNGMRTNEPTPPCIRILNFMETQALFELLESYRRGELGAEEIARKLQRMPFEKAGDFATVDLHRGLRCGSPEVIFGQGKTVEQLSAIARTLLKHGEGVLITRLASEAVEPLKREFPEGEHNALGRTFRVKSSRDPGPKLGRVVVVTAGTSDLPVAEEAARPPRLGIARSRWSPMSAWPVCIGFSAGSTSWEGRIA